MSLGESMKKQDKIDLAIGKCFAQSSLNEEECDLIKSINIMELATKHGLNENQSNLVKSWCKLSQQRMLHEFDYETKFENGDKAQEATLDIYDLNLRKED